MRTASTRRQAELLWGLFFATAALGLSEAVCNLLGRDLSANRILAPLRYALPAALLLVHATGWLGVRRGLCFVAVTMGLGLLAEVVGLHHGTLFGGRYVYHGGRPRVFDVPLAVPVFWSVFLYEGYCLSTSLLYWLGRGTPSRRSGGLGLLGLLVVLDGLAVVTIDLALEPLLVRQGLWSWLDQGCYYGVPMGNFLGWFLVAAVSTGLFRTIEYVRPRGRRFRHPRVHLMPGLCYAVLLLVLISWALREGMPHLAGTVPLVMGPLIVANTLAFLRWRRLRRGDARTGASDARDDKRQEDQQGSTPINADDRRAGNEANPVP